MQARNVLYAAVGAPIVAARKVSRQVSTLKEKISSETSNYGEAAEKAINSWASEGEKVVSHISQGKVVEEISSKVDLDQAKEQVSKLRDQLEDMLETWRTSFRPEKTEDGETPPPEKPKAPAAKKPADKPAADKPAAKQAAKTSAAKTTKSSAAAKTSSTKPASASEAEKAS